MLVELASPMAGSDAAMADGSRKIKQWCAGLGGWVGWMETLAERHWTLVYLLQHPGWKGEGVLVEKRGASGTVLVPELALEIRLHLNGDPALDTHLALSVAGIHLPSLDVSLQTGR